MIQWSNKEAEESELDLVLFLKTHIQAWALAVISLNPDPFASASKVKSVQAPP